MCFSILHHYSLSCILKLNTIVKLSLFWWGARGGDTHINSILYWQAKCNRCIGNTTHTTSFLGLELSMWRQFFRELNLRKPNMIFFMGQRQQTWTMFHISAPSCLIWALNLNGSSLLLYKIRKNPYKAVSFEQQRVKCKRLSAQSMKSVQKVHLTKYIKTTECFRLMVL